jgi:lipopolysaccharide export system permease protein
MRLNRLDRYVAANVLGSYAASLLFLVFLMIVFETLRNVADYARVASKLGLTTLQLATMIGRYHLLNIPFLFVNVAPFVTVIAVMFAVSRLMAQNEIVPMLFTGRSMLRVLRPALLTAVGSGVAMGLMWELVLTRLVEPRDRMQSLLETGEVKESIDDLVVRPGGGSRRLLFFVTHFFPREARIEGLLLFDRGSSPEDSLRVSAAEATWDAQRGDWALVGGSELKGNKGNLREWLGLPEVTPDQLFRAGKSSREASDLSYSELLDLRQLKPGRQDYVITFHRHFTFPLANLVLMLLALPFAVNFERGRRIERVIFAIAVCAVYLVFDLACQNAGFRGWLHPLVSAWLPTLVFGSFGLVSFAGMRT